MKNKSTLELGDFQTPQALALQVTKVVQQIGLIPQSIIEPTCGKGAFILAAIQIFNNLKKIIGVEINPNYLKQISLNENSKNIQLINDNFFNLNWNEIINGLPEPILIIGNPPWVTSAELGKLESFNLPKKSNFQAQKGLDALTGKSNFDISESMILQHLEWLKQRRGTIAMLCKTAVARKVLIYGWKHHYPIKQAWIYQINALKYFNAAVDAGLLVLNLEPEPAAKKCFWFENLSDSLPKNILEYEQNILVADSQNYHQYKHLYGVDKNYIWRSGIKHDCASIMELEKTAQGYQNRAGVHLSLEENYIYPLLKSSDLGNERISQCKKYVLVTQKYIGEDTKNLEKNAPKIWKYLQANREAFAKRKSSIYKNHPRFSIFGVGNYTFSPWKVAISGLYKQLNFMSIGPREGKPVIFDDTITFLNCYSEKESRFIAEILNSEAAQLFLKSMIFWRDKRPITINLLKRLNLQTLAKELGREKEYLLYLQKREKN
ncbi:N-6 DNA methylase [Gloeothece verrucosa]|uniref:Modification methylase NspV n=1 Tax=Gloeothece verrucosa (strain PCC 7822) TaxID=497965 RepID=E0UA01_GLOV7|nr:N-6 DNA methylase [Gloeothece verrucosa]ADN16193.1 modification methylase NspV [Gloeothece verrucosa PCC 7822]